GRGAAGNRGGVGAGAGVAAVMVGLKAAGVRQLRHAEQVDLMRHDQGGPRPEPTAWVAGERVGRLWIDPASSCAGAALMAPGSRSMTNYARMYRFGFTPWERYATVAGASISALLDREEAERSRRLGRALDLGCRRGQYTPKLARRGWEAVGIDYVPAAIEAAAAKSRGVEGLRYVVGDVTRLESATWGRSTSSSTSAAPRGWTP